MSVELCNLAGKGNGVKGIVGALSTLIRNVPIVNLLEMSPFVDVEQNIAVEQYEQGWGARGEGAVTEPLPARSSLD